MAHFRMGEGNMARDMMASRTGTLIREADDASACSAADRRWAGCPQCLPSPALRIMPARDAERVLQDGHWRTPDASVKPLGAEAGEGNGASIAVAGEAGNRERLCPGSAVAGSSCAVPSMDKAGGRRAFVQETRHDERH
jgi:hypothetical protein